jgi:hypothetical protein
VSTAYAVTGVLDRRERELENRLLGRSVVAAVVLHLAGAGAALLVPRLTQKPPTPIEYVARREAAGAEARAAQARAEAGGAAEAGAPARHPDPPQAGAREGETAAETGRAAEGRS